MTPRQLELALRKQRLQIRSATLRGEFAAHALTFAPLFSAGDRAREGARWLKNHPPVVAGAAVALLVARPRALLRWARRSFLAWQAWGRLRTWLSERHPAGGM